MAAHCPTFRSASDIAAFLRSKTSRSISCYALLVVCPHQPRRRTWQQAFFGCFRQGSSASSLHDAIDVKGTSISVALAEAGHQGSTADYSRGIQGLLQDDLSLRLAVQLAARHAERGELLVTELPLCASVVGHTFSGVRIFTCLYADDDDDSDEFQAAVLLSHSDSPTAGARVLRKAPGDRLATHANTDAVTGRHCVGAAADATGVVAPPLLAVNGACCCVTVLQYPGSVLYQNPRSVAYFGDLTDQPLGVALLQALLLSEPQGFQRPGGDGGAVDPVRRRSIGARRSSSSGPPPQRLQEMMRTLEAGLEYEAVVQVPEAMTDLAFAMPPTGGRSSWMYRSLPDSRRQSLDTVADPGERELLDALMGVPPRGGAVSARRGGGGRAASLAGYRPQRYSGSFGAGSGVLWPPQQQRHPSAAFPVGPPRPVPSTMAARRGPVRGQSLLTLHSRAAADSERAAAGFAGAPRSAGGQLQAAASSPAPVAVAGDMPGRQRSGTAGLPSGVSGGVGGAPSELLLLHMDASGSSPVGSRPGTCSFNGAGGSSSQLAFQMGFMELSSMTHGSGQNSWPVMEQPGGGATPSQRSGAVQLRTAGGISESATSASTHASLLATVTSDHELPGPLAATSKHSLPSNEDLAAGRPSSQSHSQTSASSPRLSLSLMVDRYRDPLAPSGGAGRSGSLPSLACLMSMSPTACDSPASETLQKVIKEARASTALRRQAALRRSSSQKSISLALPSRFSSASFNAWEAAPCPSSSPGGSMWPRSVTTGLGLRLTGARSVTVSVVHPSASGMSFQACALSGLAILDKPKLLQQARESQPAWPQDPPTPRMSHAPPHHWSSLPAGCPDVRTTGSGGPAANCITELALASSGAAAAAAETQPPVVSRERTHITQAEPTATLAPSGSSLSSNRSPYMRLSQTASAPEEPMDCGGGGGGYTAAAVLAEVDASLAPAGSRGGSPSPAPSALELGLPYLPLAQPHLHALQPGFVRPWPMYGRRSSGYARAPALRTIPDDERCAVVGAVASPSSHQQPPPPAHYGPLAASMVLSGGMHDPLALFPQHGNGHQPGRPDRVAGLLASIPDIREPETSPRGQSDSLGSGAGAPMARIVKLVTHSAGTWRLATDGPAPGSSRGGVDGGVDGNAEGAEAGARAAAAAAAVTFASAMRDEILLPAAPGYVASRGSHRVDAHARDVSLASLMRDSSLVPDGPETAAARLTDLQLSRKQPAPSVPRPRRIQAGSPPLPVSVAGSAEVPVVWSGRAGPVVVPPGAPLPPLAVAVCEDGLPTGSSSLPPGLRKPYADGPTAAAATAAAAGWRSSERRMDSHVTITYPAAVATAPGGPDTASGPDVSNPSTTRGGGNSGRGLLQQHRRRFLSSRKVEHEAEEPATSCGSPPCTTLGGGGRRISWESDLMLSHVSGTCTAQQHTGTNSSNVDTMSCMNSRSQTGGPAYSIAASAPTSSAARLRTGGAASCDSGGAGAASSGACAVTASVPLSVPKGSIAGTFNSNATEPNMDFGCAPGLEIGSVFFDESAATSGEHRTRHGMPSNPSYRSQDNGTEGLTSRAAAMLALPSGPFGVTALRQRYGSSAGGFTTLTDTGGARGPQGVYITHATGAGGVVHTAPHSSSNSPFVAPFTTAATDTGMGTPSTSGRGSRPHTARRRPVQTSDRLRLLVSSLSQIQQQQQQMLTQQLQQLQVQQHKAPTDATDGSTDARFGGTGDSTGGASIACGALCSGGAASSRGGGDADEASVTVACAAADRPTTTLTGGVTGVTCATSRFTALETGNEPFTPLRRVWHKVHVVLSAVTQPTLAQQQQQQLQSGDSAAAGGPCMTLTITQIDVTEQVEAQARLSKLLEQEHKVLEGIFPRHVIEYMTLNQLKPAADTVVPEAPPAGADGSDSLLTLRPGSVTRMASLATWHPAVTILFADCVGFTSMCQAATPLAIMAFLNQLYSRFDDMIDIYKVYKVETIGDCYMVAGGLVAYDEDGYKSVISGNKDPLHAVRTMEFAKAMLRASREVRMPDTGEPVQMRIGLHSGPVTSGVVGDRMPRFCLFGDTVNTASRMESTCRPGSIHVSAATQAQLPNESWRDCGMTAVKGKGEMRTYDWAGDVDTTFDDGQLHRVIGLYL